MPVWIASSCVPFLRMAITRGERAESLGDQGGFRWKSWCSFKKSFLSKNVFSALWAKNIKVAFSSPVIQWARQPVTTPYLPAPDGKYFTSPQPKSPSDPILVSLAYWPRAIKRHREFKCESILIKVLNFNFKKHHLTQIYKLDDMITGNCKDPGEIVELFATFSFNSTDCVSQTRGNPFEPPVQFPEPAPNTPKQWWEGLLPRQSTSPPEPGEKTELTQ